MPVQVIEESKINAKSSKQPTFFFGFQIELAGLAFHLSWLFLFLYAQPSAGCKSEVVEKIGGFSSLYLFSSIALVATLLAFVIAGRHAEAVLRKRIVVYTAMALTCAGTSVYYLAALAFPDLLGNISPSAGALTGVGSAILAVRWVWGFENISSATIMASAPSILAVTALCCVTIPHLPAPCTAFSVSMLPLLSGFFALQLTQDNGASSKKSLHHSAERGAAKNNTAPSASQKRSLRKTSTSYLFYLLLCGGIALLGLTLGITRQSVVPLFSFDAVTVFLGSAAGAIFVGSAFVIQRTPGASLSANLMGPAIVIASFLVVLASTQPDRLAENLEALGHICLEMLFFAVLVIAARRFSMYAVTVFAAGRVTYALSNMIAVRLTALYAASATVNAIVQLTSFALLVGIEVIMVAAVAVVVLPKKRPSHVAIREASYDITSEATTSESILSATEAPNSAITSPASHTSAVPEGVAAAYLQNPNEQSPEKTDAQRSNPEGGRTTNSLLENQDEEPKAPMQLTDQLSGASSESIGKIPFQQRVITFARTYQLTSREKEVTKHLLMGHSYSRIMQELCIAEGTVNCHARNIYAKAGVHSRQELMELFETDFSK